MSDDNKNNNGGPMAEETRAYLDEAEARRAALPTVEAMRADVAHIAVPAAADLRLPLKHDERGRFAPGVVHTVSKDIETLIAPLNRNDQQKVRRLKRRYDAAIPVDMHRHPDHATSIEAARAVVEGGMSELQEIIYQCFVRHGAMTDEQLEELPEVERLNLGKTTARRRRTDLVRQGKLVIVGTAKNVRGRKMNCYDIRARVGLTSDDVEDEGKPDGY